MYVPRVRVHFRPENMWNAREPWSSSPTALSTNEFGFVFRRPSRRAVKLWTSRPILRTCSPGNLLFSASWSHKKNIIRTADQYIIMCLHQKFFTVTALVLKNTNSAVNLNAKRAWIQYFFCWHSNSMWNYHWFFYARFVLRAARKQTKIYPYVYYSFNIIFLHRVRPYCAEYRFRR